MNMVSRLVPAAGEWPIRRNRVMPEPPRPVIPQPSKNKPLQAKLMRKERLYEILEEVAVSTGVTVACLTGATRQSGIVRARHFAIWRMFTEAGASFAQIGRVMNRDRTSIQHAVEMHSRRIAGGL